MNKIIKSLKLVLIALFFLSIDNTCTKYVLNSSYDMNVILSIDKKAPIIKIVDINSSNISNGGIATENATIEFLDDLSGIHSAIYKYNSQTENFDNCTSNKLTTNTKFSNRGWYYFEVSDKAGNKTTKKVYLDYAVCKINNVYYRKLETAISTVPSTNVNTTIIMLRNVSESNTIPKNKNITLDISKKTITGTFTINSGATLEAKNGVINSNVNSSVFINSGILKISSGTFTSSNSHTINNLSGSTIISNGTIKNVGEGIIVNIESGSFTITNGNLINTGSNAGIYIKNGTANLNGGRLTHTSTSACDVIAGNNLSILNIDGMIIENATSSKNGWACISSSGTVNIRSGIVKNATCGRAIYMSGGKLTISGGTISNVLTYGMPCVDTYNCILKMTAGTITSSCDVATLITYNTSNISGGSIINTGSGMALKVDSGKCQVTGGTFNSKMNYAIYKAGGECTVSNATIIGKTLY